MEIRRILKKTTTTNIEDLNSNDPYKWTKNNLLSHALLLKMIISDNLSPTFEKLFYTSLERKDSEVFKQFRERQQTSQINHFLIYTVAKEKT